MKQAGSNVEFTVFLSWKNDMIPQVKPIMLRSCLKTWRKDLDKALAPEQTIALARGKLQGFGADILAGTRRIDTGRLGIPVYLGICGPKARAIISARKQMGKGSSKAQAEASAIMELMERYAFFSFWAALPHVVAASYSEAENLFGEALLPVSEILKSVQDNLDEATARKLLDLRRWQFYPATELATGRIVWLPIDWFRLLGEFNGSSAGNTAEESLLQGLCELVERHASCLVERQKPRLPTIDQQSIDDEVLRKLCAAFSQNGIQLILKDMSLGLPLPTVAALAFDPATFPHDSEIVFTAGTASSPAKAAIRAVTEVAQLGGDFCTRSCYQASGLPKFASLEECRWLREGPLCRLGELPNADFADLLTELQTAIAGLAPVRVFAIETTNPELGIPAHWTIAPGLEFRERDKNQCLGLFLGRLLVEQAEPDEAAAGLAEIAKAYPDAPFLAFFEAMLALRLGENERAAQLFAQACLRQPDAQARSLAEFYTGYALTQAGRWQEAITPLRACLERMPDMKEAANLLGVCHFKQKQFLAAEQCFDKALAIDKGSAMDLANRGLARKFLGKKAEARQDLEAALELDSSLEFARQHLLELQKG